MNELTRQALDIEKLRKENEKLIQENRMLMDSVDFFTQALLWTGGAEEFKKEGKAKEGWDNILARLTQEISRIEKMKKDKNYWNIR